MVQVLLMQFQGVHLHSRISLAMGLRRAVARLELTSLSPADVLKKETKEVFIQVYASHPLS
jgi:hypothetical protein